VKNCLTSLPFFRVGPFGFEVRIQGAPVVKDAFSDSDHRSELADGIARESDDQLLQSPVGNLTQELAQLLAASDRTEPSEE
jgi:hypothetical protein